MVSCQNCNLKLEIVVDIVINRLYFVTCSVRIGASDDQAHASSEQRSFLGSSVSSKAPQKLDTARVRISKLCDASIKKLIFSENLRSSAVTFNVYWVRCLCSGHWKRLSRNYSSITVRLCEVLRQVLLQLICRTLNAKNYQFTTKINSPASGVLSSGRCG